MSNNTPTAEFERFPKCSKRLQLSLLIVGLAGLLVSFCVSFFDERGLASLSHAWLIASVTVLSVGLGALFFLGIQYVTGSSWSVTSRRIVELLSLAVIPGAIAFIPLIASLWLGDDSLFKWNNEKYVLQDPLLQHKVVYLNAPFFTIRSVLYLVVWVSLALMYWRNSTEQDRTGDFNLTRKIESRSPVALIALGVTTTFAAFDWLMTIDAHWFSTIFGIYLFSASFTAVLAITSVIACRLHGKSEWKETISTNHLHDLGKMLFGFNCFWAYIAFSQYLLIWYANIPEETMWYRYRTNDGWQYMALALIVVHFILPFLLLMPRASKRNPNTLLLVAILILVGHVLDMCWLIAPHFETLNEFGTAELSSMAGLCSLSIVALLRFSTGHLMVPRRDPRLTKSMNWTSEIMV